jgi:hypothetical protein
MLTDTLRRIPFLFCDWSMFSSADLSCGENSQELTCHDGFWYDFSESQVGGGGLSTTPHPLNTPSHDTAARRPPHPSYTQQHTTTLHNSTRVRKTTNVPVVFMALLLFWAQMTLASLVPFQGSKKVSIFRAHPFQCPS